MVTRPKFGSWNFEDQGLFVSAYDVGCRSTNSAAANKALIVTALTGMTDGGVLIIPHTCPHNFTSSDFPVTSEQLCVIELTGNSFKFFTNTTHTTTLGQILASIRLDTPKAIEYDLVDTLTDPATYTFKFMVYDNSGSPTISGSSYDVCYFIPGVATPVEAIARSGAVPGMHYFFKGINVSAGNVILKGLYIGSKTIATPTDAGTTTISEGVEHLILNHSGTIAAHTIQLPTSTVTNGYAINIFSRSAITAVTLTATGGKSVATGHAITALAAGESVGYIYNSGDTSWYRIR